MKDRILLRYSRKGSPFNCFFVAMQLMFTLLLLVIPVFVFSQEGIRVSGIVFDANTRETLPGVSVSVRGTSQGTFTNADGQFEIQVSSDTDVLEFSFVGYELQAIEVASHRNMEVALLPSVSELDEFVVVGYGMQQKKLVTGATVNISGQEIKRRNNLQALHALQGQSPGVQITSESGQPGFGIKVVIRGLGTIGNVQPLYIVDGVQTRDISFLNTADIESIDVLKDAASSAIYGSQAGNGVVLITTRSGHSRDIRFSFDSYYGVQEVEKKVELLNSREYATIMNEARVNSGRPPYFTQEKIDEMGEGTNWVNEMIYDGAGLQNYTFGLDGGTDASVYSWSVSYTGQEGIIGGPEVSNYERFNFRVNSEHKLYRDIIKAGQSVNYSYVKQRAISIGPDNQSSHLGKALQVTPFLPMYDDNENYLNNSPNAGVMHQGKLWVPFEPEEYNPYALMMFTSQGRNNSQKLFGNIFLEATPVSGLNYRTTFGFDYAVGEGRSYLPEFVLGVNTRSFNLHDRASQSMDKVIGISWNQVLSYQYSAGGHSFSTLAGMEAFAREGTWLNVSNTSLIISDLQHAYIANTTNSDIARISFNGGPFEQERLLSYFGRFGYDFMGTYLFNATVRADGSSKFAKDNRWGYFPSVSAGWIMTNEPFMESIRGWMDFLKIRASWGQAGNQRVSGYQYLAPISIGATNYYFGPNDFDAGGNTVGAYPSRLPNEDLRWETSEQTNIGTDAYFLNYRLGLNFDWYIKSTKDWILQSPVLATAGASPPFINGGDVRNTGMELALAWRDQVGNMNYFISGNVSHNTNEVRNVPTLDGIIHGWGGILYDNSPVVHRIAQTGFPIGYFWGWKTDGVFQNMDEVLSHTNSEGKVIQPGAKPGDLRYVDHNDDGSIGTEDKVMIGNPNPDFIFGFSMGFDFKGFDLSLSAHGVTGNQILQSYRNYARPLPNYTKEILGRWNGEGTSNTIPRVTTSNINYQASDIFIKDGAFLRISNISLGYDFAQLANSVFLSQLRVYASVQNALTFTRYNGMDPEIGYGQQQASSGIDIGYYPRPRTFLLGLNVKF
jgi:TonB-dependent starch-binding outer membrane protein SusC